MKNIFLAIAACACCGGGSLSAQDIYKVEKFSTFDLNGDARYVGMGGAMSALGANLSAVGNNPASSALYRRGDASVSGGFITNSGDSRDAEYFNSSKTKASIDQMGFVYTFKLDDSITKFVNFGFNYKKSRNFRNLMVLNDIPLPVAMMDGQTRGMSQSWQMRDLAQISDRWLDLTDKNDRAMTTPLAILGYETFLIDPVLVDNKVSNYKPSYAEAYHYGRANQGGIQQYDFNLSFNFSERYYLGVNIGVYNIDAQSSLEYEEASLGEDGKPFFAANGQRKTYVMNQEEQITGTGVDAKFGFIARPLAESPLRLGLSVTTPTFYSISSSTRLDIRSHHGHTNSDTGKSYDYTTGYLTTTNDYLIRTPWKVNFSIGSTIGNRLAIGAEYEIADHLSAQVRYLESTSDGPYYNWGIGRKDKVMQYEIDNYLKDVHTLRLGLEGRIAQSLFARVGYNWVSSPFSKNAFLNLYTDSPSYQYSTSTDYANLGSIHRYTCGLGYRGDAFYIDAAYQYQKQGVDVYPFHYNAENRVGEKNDLPAQHLDLKRHGFILTLGYRF